MTRYNTSSAYDLSAYGLPKQKEQPDIKVIKSGRQASAQIFSFQVLSAFAIVVTLLSVILYNQVQLTEVTDQVSALSKELALMESENIKMTSKLEATMNVRTIGEQAKNELGMSKLDQHQTVYVYLQQEDKIEKTEYAPDLTLGQRAKASLTGLIGKIQDALAPLLE